MANSYIDLTRLKDSRTGLNISATSADALLLELCEAASRAIDGHCSGELVGRRHFYSRIATRVYTPAHGSRLDLPDDLLSITTLKTDDDDDLTYENTWAVNTDYELYPYNAPAENRPYWRLRTRPDGNYTFPAGHQQGVQIVGKWGFWEDLVTLTATLNEALDTSETGVDVSDGTVLAVGQTILIDSEQMYVTAISTNTLTVERAVNGTTAASHLTAATIQRYRYPRQVVTATLMMVSRWWKRKDDAFAQQLGSPDLGIVQIGRALDWDVQLLLSDFALG